MKTTDNKVTKVYATGNVGRRLVHEIEKKPRRNTYTIFRINDLGQKVSCERGAKTLRGTLAISANVLRSQRYTEVSTTP